MSDDTPQPVKPKRPLGAPSMPFDQEIADIICERIATCTLSLTSICKADDALPSVGMIFKWMRDNPEFEKSYARAKDAQIEALMDETIEISDNATNDYMERLNFDGAETGWHLNGDAVARSRLRIDTRKWLASKLKPKKYGEKLGVDTVVSVSPDLQSMMERIATGGTRLTPEDVDKKDDE